MHKNEAPVQAGKKKKPAGKKKLAALSLLQALPDPVLSFVENGRVTFVNNAAQVMFGRDEKTLLASKILDLLDKGGPLYLAVEGALRSGRGMTLRDVTIAGHYAHTVSLLLMQENDTHIMVVTLHAQHMKSEWTNHARQTLKPAPVPSNALARDIRDPLISLKDAIEMMGKLQLKSDQRELLNIIRRESDSIMRLAGEAAVLEAVAPANFGSVNIHHLLAQVTEAARTAFGPGIEVHETYDHSLPELHGDYDHLLQAKMNLLKNAAEAFGGDSGKISVRTFYDHAASHHPETLEKLPLTIEIEDNGQGIDAETQRRMFDPYFTTKPNGQGLGLSAVSKIVSDHGGAIDVQSQPGKTVFRLSFPVKPVPS